jgi:3,4-dihydroxy 2-butanone 4-phosphate synthase / GTP cyclohydrolase II
MKLDSIESVIADVQKGRPIVMVDDVDRENEGDLMVAAEKVTAESINFMMTHGRGLICLSLSESNLAQLAIPMQVAESGAVFGTNFTLSIDHQSVSGCGFTAESRAKTIKFAVDEVSRPQDFLIPGFVFPLKAKPGGVLQRRGQTEGSVDLAKISGLKPAGVICEIMGEDGVMLRGGELSDYCKDHDLKITSVEQIVAYRLENEICLRRVAETRFECFVEKTISKNLSADLKVLVYADDVDNKEHLVFVAGEPKNGCLVRIHSECLTGDIFSSKRCDCGHQFSSALDEIINSGEGILIYLSQEGRGIGLANKLKAYKLQDGGLDTIDANIKLGFSADSRDYRAGAHILGDLGISKVKLITNNPDKLKQLEKFGIEVTDRISMSTSYNEFNTEYLNTKRDRLGHLLGS